MSDPGHAHRDPRHGAQILSQLSLFKGFSEKELVDVYCLGEVRLYRHGSHIVIEGENSSGLYVILKGHTAVFKQFHGDKQGEIRIATLQEGSAFGELSLVDQSPRSATVVAEGAVTAFFLEGQRWREAMGFDAERRAKFYENCALIMALRLRELDESYLLSQRQLWRHVFSKTKVS